MVSSTLIKLSSPVARSCLLAISVILLVDAIFIILEATHYPYMIPNFNELYMPSSHSITVVYTGVSIAAILLSVSTSIVSYKSSTNYTVILACINAVFLPVTILVYFSTSNSRYKVGDYLDDYYQMISNYRLPDIEDPVHQVNDQPPDAIAAGETTTVASIASTLMPVKKSDAQIGLGTGDKAFHPTPKFHKLNSIINLIDIIQNKFSCCGVDSKYDWIDSKNNYIPPTCCNEQHRATATSQNWTEMFKVELDHTFIHCDPSYTFDTGCVAALKGDEKSKYAWLGNLMMFLIIATIANTILSMLLFGLNKTEEIDYASDEHELSVVGVSTKPRPSQPTITSIAHRPSVVQTLGQPPMYTNPKKESIANLSQAVRFNLTNSPRNSISGPSKFSAAARRGSSFI